MTGNMLWLVVEHPETRPDQRGRDAGLGPAYHFVVPNATWDDRRKAMEGAEGPRHFQLRKFFSHQFDLRLSAKLAELGYEMEPSSSPAGTAAWNTTPGTSRRLPAMRRLEVRSTTRTAAAPGNRGRGKGNRRGEEGARSGARRISCRAAQDKLATTTRLAKRKADDLTLDDLRAYWDSRLTTGRKRPSTPPSTGRSGA